MPPTVHDILRESGFSDEQIAGLEPKAITAFSGVLSAAQQAQERAELAQRANADFYDNQIVPALTGWDDERQRTDNEMARARAEAAFYREQNMAARQTGFVAADAPTFQQRDNSGRWVANVPGATPGSPTFDVNQVYQRAGDAVQIISDIQWEHQRLYGVPLPVSPSELIRQADQMKLDPKTYAARTFNWDARRSQMADEAKKAERDKIVREVEQRKDREWSERTGNNPDVRRGMDSRYAEASRAVRAGERPDPLTMGEQQRRAATAQAIRSELAEAEK
jgi:hypothetical protein